MQEKSNLAEQGDIGRSRSEAGVRTKTLDEGRRSRHLQDYHQYRLKKNRYLSISFKTESLFIIMMMVMTKTLDEGRRADTFL